MPYRTGNMKLADIESALADLKRKIAQRDLEVLDLGQPGAPFIFGTVSNRTDCLKVFENGKAVFSISWQRIGNLDEFFVTVYMDQTGISCPSSELLIYLISIF